MSAWIQQTYMLQDAAAQATNKLIEYLWCCEIVGVNCLNLAQVLMEASQVVVVAVEAVVVVLVVKVVIEVAVVWIPKSNGGGNDQSPNGVDDRELNPSKNCPNADVAVDGNTSVDNMLMVLPATFIDDVLMMARFSLAVMLFWNPGIPGIL
ncbi:hypothetical protein G9A89_011830 [Geosiphon pyriformis]|nr:hypothetical protein G9A89_011830 [Geosiphon pyriformis]